MLMVFVSATKTKRKKRPPYVMVKVSPDQDNDDDVPGICHEILASGVDGVIVGVFEIGSSKTRV